MKILEGGMRQWCQHENLEFNSDGPVIGLFAETGDGKTNFLLGIDYLLTGELPKSKERYIRNYDPEAVGEDGKKPKWRADLWARFSQGGQTGVIRRWITPTTAGRELEWDGKTYKKAKEVEALLEEILGADRKTVSSAIFIGQGELKSLLFGTLAEREKLFIKMLNLGHLGKVEGAAESRQKLLMSQIEDLSASKDEAMLAISQAARAADDERKTLDAMPDHTSRLASLRAISSDISALSRDRADLVQKRQKLTTEKEALKTYCAQNSVRSVDDMTVEMEKVKSLGTALREQLNEAKAQQEASERIKAVENARGVLLQSQTELAEAEKHRPEESEDDLRKEEEKVQKMVDLSRDIEDKRTKLSGTQVMLEGVKEKLKAFEDLEALEKEVENLQIMWRSEQEHLKVLEAAAAGDNEDGACPVCGNEISEHLLSEENLEDVRSRVAKNQLGAQTKKEELDERKRERDEAVSNRKTYEIEIERLEGEIDEIDQVLQDRDRATMLARLDSLHEKLDAHANADEKVGNLPGIIESQSATYENLKSALQPDDEAQAGQYNPSLIPLFEQRIEEAIEKYQGLESAKGRMESLGERITDLEEEIDRKVEKTTELENVVKSSISNLGEEFSSWGELVSDLERLSEEVQGSIDRHDAEQGQRNTQAGIVSARDEAVREAKGRLAELEDRESKDARRRGIAEVMKKFKDVFSRTGLAKRFIRYRFEQLAALTQENLTAMEANFAVFPSDDVELSFDFVRVDDSTGYVMQQDQLSGGQSVVLSIAFLLAVQQLVVPEIGFLVLDEPSLHLDEKCRNDLKDLLVGLSEQLRNSEAQVFVADHSPDLRPAFQRLIQLKKAA